MRGWNRARAERGQPGMSFIRVMDLVNLKTTCRGDVSTTTSRG
jgi:hypothetical protein